MDTAMPKHQGYLKKWVRCDVNTLIVPSVSHFPLIYKAMVLYSF